MPQFARNYPLISYAVGFIVLFVIAFSAFSNFGILARQRTQVLPLYLVLLALPPRHRRTKRTVSDPGGALVGAPELMR
ncbi:MAG: hypothetical protein QOI55_493, partial [Actinomycetota bacterium]|jgi:hypothetical protein|nr:hypothetical protein [Actinomycetota bacterium]